ncbi:hypothetical protein [Acidisoma sp. 7E03]
MNAGLNPSDDAQAIAEATLESGRLQAAAILAAQILAIRADYRRTVEGQAQDAVEVFEEVQKLLSRR